MTTEQVCIFTESNLENINKWLRDNPDIEIQERLMAASATGVISIAIFYIEKPAPRRPAKTARAPRGKLSIAK